MFRKRGKRGGEATRLFYACDIHGSEPTYRKFLNAAKFYEVDALVFGGDLMGKLLVPIVRDGGEWRAGLHGQKHHLTTPVELAAFKKSLDTLGFYWFECDTDEYQWYEGHQDRIDQKFDELAKARLAEWVELAENRLAGSHVRVYLCGGNDDTERVLSALDEVPLDRVVNCENRIVPLDDDHTMATIGYSTPTPWDTPRERTDEQIGEVGHPVSFERGSESRNGAVQFSHDQPTLVELVVEVVRTLRPLPHLVVGTGDLANEREIMGGGRACLHSARSTRWPGLIAFWRDTSFELMALFRRG